MIRLAKNSEKNLIKEIWYEAFLEHDSKANIDFYFENIYKSENTLVLIEEERIKCTLQLNQHKLIIDGKPEPVSFVVGVATPKHYTRQGYMKKLLNYAIEYARTKLNQRIMILQAYNWDIYRSFGFEDEYYKSRLELDKHVFSAYEEKQLEKITIKKVLDIYKTYCAKFNGYVLRDEKYYQLMIEYNRIDGIEYAIYNNAYISYKVENEILHCYEAAFENHYDLFTLIKTVKSINKCMTVILYSDIYNFDYYKYNKELFMMALKLEEDVELTEPLFISEFV